MMTASSCPHAWLEPLRTLFTDIGLAPEEYSRAGVKTVNINQFNNPKVLTISECVTPCYAGVQRFLDLGYGLAY